LENVGAGGGGGWKVTEHSVWGGDGDEGVFKGTVSRDFLINLFVLMTKSVLFVKPLIVLKFFCKSFVC
jgi:hypothetical protein